jgi:hypothetical protein
MPSNKQQDFVNGVVTINKIKYLLTTKGGGGVCLHFLSCDRILELELKFASVLLEVESF